MGAVAAVRVATSMRTAVMKVAMERAALEVVMVAVLAPMAAGLAPTAVLMPAGAARMKMVVVAPKVEEAAEELKDEAAEHL